MKKTVFWGLLVILLAFGFIGCDTGNVNGEGTFTVTIGTLTNGTITATPTSGVEGTEITLTVTPNTGYQLKAGTLKYGTTAINETTQKFYLPAANVTVTAEFESLFIGSWQIDTSNDIYTFFENIYTRQTSSGVYRAKGKWNTEAPNKFILIQTHSGYSAKIEELTKLDNDNIGEYVFEFISNSMFKLIGGGNEYNYTLLE